MANNAPTPDRYAVIGHPVKHSCSPMIHQIFARQTGENMTYELLDVTSEAFEATIRGFDAAGGKGLNVTVPHKQAAFDICTEISARAERARAVNTLIFLSGGGVKGDNTDGVGFIRDLETNHCQAVAGRSILILGAGGATRGILGPLLEALPAAIVLANRTLERAEALVAEFDSQIPISACRFEELLQTDPAEIVINATSAGVRGERPAFPPECIGPASFCYDLAYGIKGTPFIAWARKHGAGTVAQGWGMLVEQAAESFEIWRGKRPNTTELLAYVSP